MTTQIGQLHPLFMDQYLFLLFFSRPIFHSLLNVHNVIKKKGFHYFCLLFLCVYDGCMWCMYMHVCAHVHSLVFVRACRTCGRDNIGLDFAFILVRDWGLCCCLLLYILCLLAHKLLAIFCLHPPFHHRSTAITDAAFQCQLLYGFRGFFLPQVLLRQVLFSGSLLYSSIYSLTFAEFPIFSAFLFLVARLPVDFWAVKIGCAIMNKCPYLFFCTLYP